MKKMILTVAAFATSVLLADVTTIYTSWPRGGYPSPTDYDWRDAQGNPVTMQNDGSEYAVIQGMIWSQAFNYGCNWNLYGLCLDNTDTSYADGSGIMGLQRGGLRCAKACRFAMAGYAATTFRLIAGPQTWEGPDSGDYASIGTGDDAHNDYPNYYKGMVVASSDVFDWTIRKRLAVWMFYENTLSHVRLRLESPARIYLPTQWGGSPSITTAPKLGVGQLTLAGEDVKWYAGVMTTATLPLSGVPPTGVLNPAMDSATVAPKLILEDGADVQVENATWDIPELVVTGSGAESAFIGDMTFVRSSTAVELRDGARLELAAVNREQGVSAGVTVAGTGVVAVATSGWGLTGTLALGEDVDLELLGVKKFRGTVSGGKSLVLNPGAGRVCSLDAELYASMSSKKITLKSGTLCLSSMSALPAAATIDIATGAAVVFSSNSGYDSSRITGAGAANVTFDSMLVTDVPVAAGEIAVYTNEVLRVAGDGLTSATTVRLVGGTLRFETSATVASPISVTIGSFVEAYDEDVVGTISGAVTCACVDSGRTVNIPVQWGSATMASVTMNGVWTLGPGSVTYAGGGTFSTARDTFVVTRDAHTRVTGGTYQFGGRGDAANRALVRLQALVSGQGYGYGRHLCVCDGGSLVFGNTVFNECIYVAAPKNGGLYNCSPWVSTFEIGTGGTVTIPSNGRIHLGSVDSRVELKLSGGLLNMASENAWLFVGEGSGTYGSSTAGADILLESGTLSLSNPIVREKGGDIVSGGRSSRGRFLWSGGTLKLNEHFAAATIFDISQELKDSPDARVNSYLRQITQISGDGCTLDLSEMGCAAVTNVPAGFNQSEWYGTGCLTVTGGKEFVMNAFPNAITIRTVGEGTRVTVPETAYVYDNTTCLQYLNASMDDGGNPYDTISSSLNSATVSRLIFAGTNCTFGVTRANLPLSVTEALVTGEWNNARSVSALGGLTLGDMEFAEGSLLSAAVRNGTTVCQPFAGTITLPSSLYVRAVRDDEIDPTGSVAMTAADGIVGTPTWVGVRRCQASNDGTSVTIGLPGMSLIFR